MWGRSILVTPIAVLAMNGIAYSQVPPPPKVVPEAPAMGGEPQTKPGPTVINIGSNEVSLARLANTKLLHVKKELLSRLSPVLFQQSQNETAPVPQDIGTVTNAFLDPTKHAITFVAVRTGSAKVLVPWCKCGLTINLIRSL